MKKKATKNTRPQWDRTEVYGALYTAVLKRDKEHDRRIKAIEDVLHDAWAISAKLRNLESQVLALKKAMR
jgi:hypothetical protein